MKPAAFRYEVPASVDEALELLEREGDEARVLAGGQSLVPMMNLRLAAPRVLIDINRITGLDGIEVQGGSLAVGALTRQRTLERSSLGTRCCPVLARCLPLVGHVATRNRGTLGGSVAHADPAGELPLVLLALGGDVEVASRSGRRRIDADRLFVGFFTTSLLPGELLLSCRFPRLGADEGAGFSEVALRHGDFALAAACAKVTLDAGGVVVDSRVALGAVTDRPVLVADAGAALVGQVPTKDVLRDAAEAARAAVEPIGSLHAPATYQRHLVGVVVARALQEAMREARHEAGAGVAPGDGGGRR